VATVESTAGPIDVAELGTTLIHEHLRFRDDAVAAQWPHLYDEEAEYTAALESARAVVDRGVATLCDPAGMYGGRDARFAAGVAEATGLNVLLCTGIYAYENLPHFFVHRDSDAMADCFVHDIEVGIQGTGVKAAFIKCAADQQGVNENVEKCLRAAARASLRTGRPIMAHSHPASENGHEQMRIFEDEGVEPSKVQIAHTGDTDDLDYIERLLDRGAWIGMDRYGLEMFLPMDRRNATLTTLLERGYADRMFLGADYCATIDWFPTEAEEQMVAAGMIDGNWSMTLLFDEVIPTLRDAGMTDEQLETMLVENPRRWLA
jgi:phosphotriesterase-related protein